MSSTGFPINGQKRLLAPIAVPTNVVETPDARIHLTSIMTDQGQPGDVLTVGYNGVVVTSTPTTGSGTFTPHYVQCAADYSADGTETIIGVSTGGGTKITVTLADPAAVTDGWPVTIRDEDGNASAGGVYWASASGSIEGAGSFFTDNGWVSFYSNGVDHWYLMGSGSVGTVIA